MKHKALIIGAGNIGAIFDCPGSKNIITHAHAYTKHRGFDLIGFIDPDKKKLDDAVNTWGGRGFNNLKEAFDCGVEVVSIAAPDEFHYLILKELANYSPKLVFVEKPIVKTLEEYQEIDLLYHSKKIPVLVNYTRRFSPEFQQIRDNYIQGVYGRYLTGTGYYGKGVLHNGSHCIDLIRFILGEVSETRTYSKIYDYYDDDPSVAASLTIGDKTFILQPVDCRSYTIFEIDFMFEKYRIRITNSGFEIEEYCIQKNQEYSGYKNLTKTRTIQTSLGQSMYFAIDNIYQYLNKNEPIKCTIEDAGIDLDISLSLGSDEKNSSVCP